MNTVQDAMKHDPSNPITDDTQEFREKLRRRDALRALRNRVTLGAVILVGGILILASMTRANASSH